MSSLQRNGEAVTLTWQDAMLFQEIHYHLNTRFKKKESPVSSHLHLNCPSCLIIEDDTILETTTILRIPNHENILRNSGLFIETQHVKHKDAHLNLEAWKHLMEVVYEDEWDRHSTSRVAGFEGHQISAKSEKLQELDQAFLKGGTPYNFIINSDPLLVVIGTLESILALTVIKEIFKEKHRDGFVLSDLEN